MKEASPPVNNPTPRPPRVPESVAAGVYATAMIAFHTNEEFVLDFLNGLAGPVRLVARVLLHPGHAKRLTRALVENLQRYEQRFGALPPPQQSEASRALNMQEFYGQLTVPDAIGAGVYANGVLIRHSREEFVLDFLTSLPPVPVVTARVTVSPGHVRRLINALEARVRLYKKACGGITELPPETGDSTDFPRFSLS